MLHFHFYSTPSTLTACLKVKTVSNCTDVARDVAPISQTQYLIISTTHQRDDASVTGDYFKNCSIFVAPASRLICCVGVASVVVLVCGQSRNCRACRRVPNRARVGVFRKVGHSLTRCLTGRMDATGGFVTLVRSVLD